MRVYGSQMTWDHLTSYLRVYNSGLEGVVVTTSESLIGPNVEVISTVVPIRGYVVGASGIVLVLQFCLQMIIECLFERYERNRQGVIR